jgi:tRNA threonylcarbamoyl adenosine modification protein YeaZ
MKILAFDTTNLIPSVGLSIDGKMLDLLEFENQKPAEILVPKIEEILAKNNLNYQDLNAVAVSCGPASFTSVRIGLSCAKALSLSLSVKFFAFDSLLAIAYQQNLKNGKVLVVIDAKMDEFFVANATFENGKIIDFSGSKMIGSDEVKKINGDDFDLICASGKDFIQGGNKAKNDKISSEGLCFLAFDALNNKDLRFFQDLSPNYIRNPSISQRKK